MKKIIKNRIFIFIMTTILFTSLGVYGATYKYRAEEISYIPSDGSGGINVNEALNELYKKSKNDVSYNEIIVELDGLAYGIEYYVPNGSDTSTAKSGSKITITKNDVTVTNTSSYGNIIYARDMGRYYVKANNININSIYARKMLSEEENSFSFTKIILNLKLTVYIIDTYTSTGSVSTSVTGNITIYPDGTFEKDDFLSSYSSYLLNSSSARYQTKAELSINSYNIY